MKSLAVSVEERTRFVSRVGPGIAQEMSKALQSLTGEKLTVGFSSVQAYEQSELFVDVGEKCFGSYVNFRGTRSNLKGVVLTVFPLSSTKILAELLLKRHFSQVDKKEIDQRVKLSAFKEAANILALTYITGLANLLKVRFKTGVPKLVCFQSVEFIRSGLSRSYADSDSLISVGQFKIVRETGDLGGGVRHLPRPLLEGALLLFFSPTSEIAKHS